MRDERIPEMSEKEIDDYLDGLEEPKKSTLAQLRETIVAIVPDAEEGISYGVPAFKLRGKVIAGFAAYKDHLSYLPHSGSVARRHARTGTNSRIGTSSNSARACLATCSMVPVGTMVKRRDFGRSTRGTACLRSPRRPDPIACGAIPRNARARHGVVGRSDGAPRTCPSRSREIRGPTDRVGLQPEPRRDQTDRPR